MLVKKCSSIRIFEEKVDLCKGNGPHFNVCNGPHLMFETSLDNIHCAS